MLIALLTKNPVVQEMTEGFAAMEERCDPLHFHSRTDLIRHLASRAAIDVVIVDADMDLDAVGRIASWRACHARTDFSILVIGQFLQPTAMARAFEMGGDDIAVGPFSVAELYARAARCMARLKTHAQDTTYIELGDYTLDQRSQRATYRGVDARLTAREFAIAWLFFSSPGSLLSRPRIAVEIWGQAADQVGRALEQHIYKLRRKLSLAGSGSAELKAVYASGYRLETMLGHERGDERGPEQTPAATRNVPNIYVLPY